MADWMSASKPVEDTAVQKIEQSQYPPEDIEKWLLEEGGEESRYCCMLYGLDGTGKSGILQSYPLNGDEKMLIIDLDGGNLPLLYTYHKDKLNKNILVRNPLVEGGEESIDYSSTINKIRQTIKFVRNNHEKMKIKAFCIDGLSTLLKYCEHLMRVEKNLTPDAGVSMRYWINRNKVFLELLEQVKALPIDVFFIGHEDFIKTDDKGDLSSVKSKTNQMMYQKVRCLREDKANKIIFKAIVDKTKYDVSIEGKEIIFCVVDKETGKANWKGAEVLEIIRGGKNENN